MATVEELYDRYYKQGKESIDKNYALKQQTTTDTLAQIDQAIDKAAETGVAGYKQSIEQAPMDALKQKGKNAVQEAINRKIVAENMANMGLTDSGLNRSQQTALTLQRGNADAAVDQSTREYVNKLQLAIDEVMSTAEKTKAQNAVTMKKEDSDWYTAALMELENSSRSAASEAYAAEQERLAEIAKAQAEAAQKAEEERRKYMMSLIDEEGMGSNQAFAQAGYFYPTGNEQTDMATAKYHTTYQLAKQQGFSDEEADAAGSFAASGVDPQTALMNVLRSGTTGVKYDKDLSKWDDSTTSFFQNIGDIFDTDKGDQEEAAKWDEDEWEKRVKNMADKAAGRVEKKYPALSTSAKQYAKAKAVVTTLAPVLTSVDNDYAIKALEQQFPSDIVTAVLADIGLEIV